MSAVDPRRVRELFLAIQDLPDDRARAQYLERECQGQNELRQRVVDLWLGKETVSNATNTPYDPVASRPMGGQAGAGESLGSVIAGKYKLLETIGEGGMGTVFKAQQIAPVRRLVAIKLIKAGFDSQALLSRFENERQALAMMEHPNIAQVLDCGTSEAGSPFLVMELFRGTPITRFADREKLTTRQRIALFIPVCKAIEHAHQKGIIHRDLKPNNILVASYEDQNIPKVIDFGLAKAVGAQLDEKNKLTMFGTVLGTPEYMSPEQASLNKVEVDTRSDVYALGIVLYELITGSTPLESALASSKSTTQILHTVRSGDIPLPSEKLRTSRYLNKIALNHQTKPPQLLKTIQGDLDAIIMKAIEKDPDNRYETAKALARDLQHFLDGEDIEAAPTNFNFWLQRFMRRFWAPIMVATLLVTGLGFGLIASGLGWFQAFGPGPDHNPDPVTREPRGSGGSSGSKAKAEPPKKADPTPPTNPNPGSGSSFLPKDPKGGLPNEALRDMKYGGKRP